MVGRNCGPVRWPPLASSAAALDSFSAVHTCRSSGKRYGWRNFVQFTAIPTASAVAPAAAMPTPRQRLRPRGGRHSISNPAATSAAHMAHPAVVRLRIVTVVRNQAVIMRTRVGRRHTSMSAQRAPRVPATAHMYASWYTHGSDARNVIVEPAPRSAPHTATPTTVSGPHGASGIRIARTRQAMRPANTTAAT